MKVKDQKIRRCSGYFLAIISLLIISGCSEIDPNPDKPAIVNTHKKGILDTKSSDFHGNLIRENKWNVQMCQQCHGYNYDGGVVNSSCITCHSNTSGPENCATCHGSETSPAPPKNLDGNTDKTYRGVGAHQVHLKGGVLGKSLSCWECHVVPGSVSSDGHIDSELPAEVIMDGYFGNIRTNDQQTLTYSQGLPQFNPDPVYDYSTSGCSSVYCHGYFKNGNLENKPGWSAINAGECGTCHGDPSKTHLGEKALPKTAAEGGTHPSSTNCSECHGGVINASYKIIDNSKHIDGLLNLMGNDIKY